MATAAQIPDQAASLINTLIRPAIVKLISESEGVYRCERDLHHHFTVCLQQIQNLELGTHRRRVYLEEPTHACYGSGRRGNLDYFFPQNEPGDFCIKSSRNGVAAELNCDYRDGYIKIKKDIQKLIDPANGYQQSLYFAYCTKRNFLEELKRGIERAFNEFAEASTDFRLPLGLHVILVEYIRTGGHMVREAAVTCPCTPSELTWKDTFVPGNSSSSGPMLVTQSVSRPEMSNSSQYVLRSDFDRQELERLLHLFESSVKRGRDRSVSDKLRQGLSQSDPPYISRATMMQLAKWCKTDGPIYSDGMDVARQISQLLFGTVLDRSQFGA